MRLQTKIYLGSVFMIFFLVMSFFIKDLPYYQFFASVPIIIGSYTYRLLLKQDRLSQETYATLRPNDRILCRRKTRVKVVRKRSTYGNNHKCQTGERRINKK